MKRMGGTVAALCALLFLACNDSGVTQRPSPSEPGDGGSSGKGGSGTGGDAGDGGDGGAGGEGGSLPPPPVDVGEHMRFWGAPHGVPGPILDVSSDAGGNVWAANRASLLLLRPGSAEWETFTEDDGLSEYPVISVAGGNANEVWVGYEGLFPDDNPFDDPPDISKSGDVDRIRIDGRTVDRFHYDISSPPNTIPGYPEARDILRTCYKVVPVLSGPAAGDVWFGCNHGMAMWHGGHGRIFEHEHTGIDVDGSLVTGDFRGIAVMPDGNVWIGGAVRSGLLRYADAGRNFWAPIDPIIEIWPPGVALDPQGYDWIMHFEPDAGGGLWIASYGNGVAYRGPGGGFTYLTTGNGLPDNRVRELALDTDGSVWMATEGGLIRWRDGAVVQLFDARDGVPGGPLSVHVDSRSSPRRVIMGTTDGVGIYDGP